MCSRKTVLQTQRYFWKVDLVNERKRELHEDAVALPEDASAHSSVCVMYINAHNIALLKKLLTS